MSRFLHSKYKELAPYVPGEQPKGQPLVKLNTNENPYPPSPKVIEAVRGAEAQNLRLYSDPEARQLVNAIAGYYRLLPEQVVVGNGSDEILAFCYMAFGEDGIRYPEISYGFYPVFSKTFSVEGQAIPLREDFSIDIRDYQHAGKTVLIANPNAPTGMCLHPAQIEDILKTNREHPVIIDEAYVDFGAESCVSLLPRYDNLVVVQTFSKSRNLAGGRLGFALASKELAGDLNKIKFSFNPYNVNRLSIAAGAAAMEDTAYFTQCTRRVVATRQLTEERLLALGFTVLASKANFLFAKPGNISGSEYFQRLRQRDILVRHWDIPKIADYVRITIGSEEEMERFYQATKEILQQAQQEGAGDAI